MPPPLLFDLSQINLDAEPLFNKDDISKINPQQYEMQQLDGIIWYDIEKFQIIGFKDVTEQEFWIRGHIPGRPLMPGVIMVEAAAQLLSFFVKYVLQEDGFIGFAGIDETKFRSTVEPGNRLYLLGQIMKFNRKKRSTRVSTKVQGIVNNVMVFETIVSGMKV